MWALLRCLLPLSVYMEREKVEGGLSVDSEPEEEGLAGWSENGKEQLPSWRQAGQPRRSTF